MLTFEYMENKSLYKRPKSRQPLPVDAKIVFQGEVYRVYSWQQKMFDGSMATFEKIGRMDSCTVIPVTIDNKIIIAKEEQPGVEAFIGALGGRMDEGETPLETAKRELMEEAGMRSENWSLLYETQPLSMLEWVDFGFVARGVEKVSEAKLDQGEKIEIFSVTYDEFLEHMTREECRVLSLKLMAYKALTDKEYKANLKKLIFGQ